MRRRGKLGLAAVIAALAAPAAARAQDPRALSSPSGQPPPTKGVEETTKRPYWGGARTRPFLAAVMEGGGFYVRPTFAVGYGKPHWQWFGLEGQTNVSTSGGSEYAGLHGATPWFDLRTGARYLFPVNQSFLEKQDRYTQKETEFRVGPKSRYVSLEAELAAAVPLLGGSLFGVGSLLNIRGVTEGYNLFEESLHVVMAPPWLWRARLGYVYGFGKEKTLRFGGAAELIGNPGREAHVVRLGPVLGVALTHHLEAVASLLAVAASPDSLRLRGAEIGQLGFRYRWATGDLYREFP